MGRKKTKILTIGSRQRMIIMKNIYTSLLVITLIFTPLVGIQAQTRGVGVRIKDEETNKTEEVQLYKASYALIIGVSDYTKGWKDLPGVLEDVKAVEAVLQKQGFGVTTIINPTRTTLRSGIDSFIMDHGYDADNRLLIYYAGHGDTGKTADGRKLGYIVPADAPLRTEDREGFRRTAIPMDEIEGYAKRIEAKHALFVFDSCFSGSLLNARRSATPPIITDKVAKPVRQFITAGTDEQEVPDKSVFREQFVAGLNGEGDLNKDGYITVTELADFLQTKVTNYTGGSQTPQYGKIFDGRLDKGDLVFVSPKGTMPAATGGSQPTETVKTDPKAGERAFWESIKNSKDADDFRAYLKAYPQGIFAPVAENSLRKLAEMTPAETNTSNLTVGTVRQFSGMSFAYIPPGEFEMGSNNGDDDEKPAHRVKISQGFWMGIYEMTQEEYEKVMGRNPSNFKRCPKCPVENVSWDDAQEFIKRLNSQSSDGSKYRLPSEAEWEYAARAGTTGDYAGDVDLMAWYDKNSGSKTHPVGQKKANIWGLYDMHGNVWEWVQDWKGSYTSGTVTDPTGVSTGSYRVDRGGGWYGSTPYLRSSERSGDSPGRRGDDLGFRLVRFH
jgi:formylglycine-generating enzyme required for sulfatase activity